jgi:hypothetical protein
MMISARNEARVREVNDKFDTKIATRLNDPRTGTIVVVAHRLHEEDLTVHLMAYGGWNRVALEMVAERDKSYQTENGTFVRSKGDLLREGLFAGRLRFVIRRKFGWHSAPLGHITKPPG